MQLTGSQQRQLCDAFEDAFTPAALRRMVRFRLDISLDTIVKDGTLRDLVFELTEWARTQGRLADLLHGAYSENSGNPRLQAAYRDLTTVLKGGEPLVVLREPAQAAGSPRPADGYRLTLRDRRLFIGRQELLQEITGAPLQVRILLGGRRFGKSSLLRAVEWSLVPGHGPTLGQAFPVFVYVRAGLGSAEETFAYLAHHLCAALERWLLVRNTPASERYPRFLQASVEEEHIRRCLQGWIGDAPAQLSADQFERVLQQAVQKLEGEGFPGLVLLLDEVEHLDDGAGRPVVFDTLRRIKDAQGGLSSRFGLILTGHLGLRDYHTAVGSPLHNIATTHFLGPLRRDEVGQLVRQRLDDEQRASETGIGDTLEGVFPFVGGHPFLAHQLVSRYLDGSGDHASARLEQAVAACLDELDRIFVAWWNESGHSDGLGDPERRVYRALSGLGTTSPSQVALATSMSVRDVRNCLQALQANGFAREKPAGSWIFEGDLFFQWVWDNYAPPSPVGGAAA